MDYFDSNMKDKMSDYDKDLPPGMAWEDMRDGVYGKMGKKTSNNPWKWFSLGLLLLMGSCGGWMALNYFQADAEQVTKRNEVAEISQDISTNERTNVSENMTSDQLEEVAEMNNEKNTPINSIPNNQSNASLNSNSTKNNNSKRVADELTVFENRTLDVVNITLDKSPSFSNQKNNPASVIINKTPAENPTAIKIIVEKSDIAFLSSKPASLFKDLRNMQEEDFDLEIQQIKKPNTKPSIHRFAIGLAGGMNNWTTFETANTNKNYISGFPGYSILAEAEYSISEKHAISLGYQNSYLQELFDYEGTQKLEIEKPNALIKQYISSLTGNVISQTHGSAIAQGTKHVRELKYNSYRLQTLQLNYAYALNLKKKTKLKLLVGGEYLFAVNGEGKRLDENGMLIRFDKTNPIFAKNQFALRAAIAYQYRIAQRTSLFAQAAGSQYLTNWEIGNNGATRPLVYGLSLGLRQKL